MINPNNRLSLRIAVLAKLPHGKENAVKREDLAQLLQMNDRTVRELLEELRDAGVMVCNDQDGKGYYLSNNLDDVERQYRRDRARALSVLKRLKTSRAMLKAAGRQV